MQQMLATGQFCGFIDSFVDIRNEETNEKTMWEYYLHKVWDMGFDEFLKMMNPEEVKPANMNDVEATVKASEGILKLFEM